jgi:NAD(P)-dependent dehydrogenase (short-subunit alcohol dehydrogenase family)
MSRLSEKRAIVTGASKGIGAGIATALAAAGARVAVNYSSDREGAERVAQAIVNSGGKAIAVGADVSKAADVARLFKEVHSAFGRLDVLVNNAGVFRFGALAEITEESFHLHYNVNVLGAILTVQEATKRFDADGREHHQPQLYRRFASRGGSPAVRFHEGRHRNTDQRIGARTGTAQDTRQRHRSGSYRNRRQCSGGNL